jgi:hypothetical protein
MSSGSKQIDKNDSVGLEQRYKNDSVGSDVCPSGCLCYIIIV